jgi:hypothetical protein
MFAWIAMLWHVTSNAIGQHAMPSTAGTGVGLAATGMIAIMWLLGDAILGALVLMTRGTKMITEETR